MGALAGCVAAPPAPEVSYRDARVRQAALLRGGAEAMQGKWLIREGTPGDLAALRFQGARVEMERRICKAGGRCKAAREAYRAEALSLNHWRLTPEAGGAALELIVLWIDADFRTAALGSRDGSFAYIIDRAPSGGADRIAAAREILAFNGYDTGALKPRAGG